MIDLDAKITTAEFEANREEIQAAVVTKDVEFIRNDLNMKHWRSHTANDRVLAIATPTPAFWKQWRRDQIQISKRLLQPTKSQNGSWIVICQKAELAAALLS